MDESESGGEGNGIPAFDGNGAGPSTSSLPPYAVVETFIRRHWYQGLIIAALLYFFGRWFLDRIEEWRSRPGAVLSDSKHLQTLEERAAAARRRQFAWSEIAAARDAELREERHRQQLEEQRRREDEIQQRLEKADGGRRLGGGAAPTAPPAAGGAPGAPRAAPLAAGKPKTAAAKPNDSDEEDANGPRKRLPKLSGAPKESHESFPGASGGGDSGGGGGRFKRNCGPKGG